MTPSTAAPSRSGSCGSFPRTRCVTPAESEHTGLLSYEDMAEWRATIEEPVTHVYRGLEVHKCSSWTQGPVFLQQLAILEGFDLAGMGHNSADYLHTWTDVVPSWPSPTGRRTTATPCMTMCRSRRCFRPSTTTRAGR